jgi:hypothetical protein
MIYIARLHRRRLKADRESLGLHATDSQKSKIQLRSNNLRRKITSWTTIQQLYIPNVHVLRSRDHATHDGQEEVPEKTELYLPSSICRSDRVNVCDLRLMKVEWMLRVPQANDALDSLRDGLRVRSFLYMDKDRFQRGQHANTRSRGIIARIEAKIAAAAATYTVAREALISLSSPLDQVGCETSFPHLKLSDIRGLIDPEDQSRNRHVPGQKRSSKTVPSEGHRTLSWIWTRIGDASVLDPKIVEDCEFHLHHLILNVTQQKIQRCGLSGARARLELIAGTRRSFFFWRRCVAPRYSLRVKHAHGRPS